jgi:hypothetical protein
MAPHLYSTRRYLLSRRKKMTDREGIMHTGALLMIIALEGTDEDVVIANSTIGKNVAAFDGLVDKFGDKAFGGVAAVMLEAMKKKDDA